MFDALVFWMMKTVAEIAITLAVVVAVVLVCGIVAAIGYIRDCRCKPIAEIDRLRAALQDIHDSPDAARIKAGAALADRECQ